MRVIKQSTRTQPRLSLILLDWGVRESFHLLHYLKNQTVPREAFEVILIEFYDTVSEPLQKFASEIDTWVLLEMPTACYYHKHLMYNAGMVLSRGEILMFGDSDAMVRPTFVETVLRAFERDPWIVYHMDEFRNVRRDFYPFHYPSFEEVLGDGCINNIGGKTKGILDDIDPIHTRNYGACMSAWRKDLIAIGGADEDLTYLGHICGPYEMTFRLMNFGRRLEWETEEYLYHTWHPGSDGIDNYLGPHDGRNMSTTAFQALCSGRIPPLVESELIRRLRTGSQLDDPAAELSALLADPRYVEAFHRSKLGGPVRRPVEPASGAEPVFGSYHGFDVYLIEGSFYAVPQQWGHLDLESTEWREDERVIRGDSFTAVRETLDSFEVGYVETVGSCNICAVGKRFAVVPHELGAIDFRVRTHRENPRIVWAETSGEARKLAAEIRAATGRPGSAPPAEQSELKQLKEELVRLDRRMAGAESAVADIYQSRTWQTLVRVGGILQGAARIVRPQKSHGKDP